GVLISSPHNFSIAYSQGGPAATKGGRSHTAPPPRTGSLWVSEGLTTYYGELMVARAGLATSEDFLASLSAHIGRLQTSPGRLVQTLEQSSLDVWNSSTSGMVRDNATKVSYYLKGPIVGFLLDAKIRRATAGG